MDAKTDTKTDTKSDECFVVDHLIDTTTQWIDSLKIHLLHPHATAIDALDWVSHNQRPCAIEKYLNLSIKEYQKGLGQPIQTGPSAIIDISVTSNTLINDVSLCWIVGDQIYYPSLQNQHYLNWMPNHSRTAQDLTYIGLIRIQPSIQPLYLTLHYKELYLPTDLPNQPQILQKSNHSEKVHISNFHVVVSQGDLSSCWRDHSMCPDPAELKLSHPPTSLGQSVHLLISSSDTPEMEDEFIQI